MTGPICFIGNSHLAAVKLGWDDTCERLPPLTVEMFGAAAAPITNVSVSDGMIVPETDYIASEFERTGGTRCIDLSKYSAYFIIGCFSSAALFQVYQRHGFLGLRSRRQYLVSRECFETAALSLLEMSWGMRLLRMIRSASAAPVTICATPLPSEACLDDTETDLLHREAVIKGDLDTLLNIYDELCRRLSVPEFTLVQQPASTRSDRGLTKREFWKGAVRLKDFSTPHIPTDYQHMNRLYGAELLSALFPAA